MQPMECQGGETDVAGDPAVDAVLLKEQQDKTSRGPKYTEMQVCCTGTVWGWVHVMCCKAFLPVAALA